MNHVVLLNAHYQGLFASLLRNAAGTEKSWDILITRLARLNLTDIVTRAPAFSKFPWVRHPLPLQRQRYHKPDESLLELVSATLADNWVQLLMRDIDELSVEILLRQDAHSLLAGMHRVAVNTATGRSVARLAVLDAVTDSAAFDQLFAGFFNHEPQS